MNRPALLGIAVLLLAAGLVRGCHRDTAAYMLVIFDSQTSTPHEAEVRDAIQWRQAADAGGITWDVVDHREARKMWPRATLAAEKAGLPAVVWITRQGHGTAEKQPATIAGMVVEVKLRGEPVAPELLPDGFTRFVRLLRGSP